jgi:inosose dehydratase
MDTRVISADPDRNAFDTLDKLVAEYDMCIGIHNHGAKHRWKTGQQMLDAVKDHDPRIGACLDTAWSIDAGDDPVAAIRLLGPRMHDIHVKDSDGTEDVIPGQGRLDLAGTIKALADVDFDGPLTVEYENHPENVQPWMIKCVAAVRAAIAKL